jgi:hypothetical protein
MATAVVDIANIDARCATRMGAVDNNDNHE